MASFPQVAPVMAPAPAAETAPDATDGSAAGTRFAAALASALGTAAGTAGRRSAAGDTAAPHTAAAGESADTAADHPLNTASESVDADETAGAMSWAGVRDAFAGAAESGDGPGNGSDIEGEGFHRGRTRGEAEGALPRAAADTRGTSGAAAGAASSAHPAGEARADRSGRRDATDGASAARNEGAAATDGVRGAARNEGAAAEDGVRGAARNEGAAVADGVRGAARRGAAAAAASTTAVRNDLSLLQPEFRGPLERVIARMEAMGHTVQVVETHRGQARQDHLYEQGRTRPGPVVTWTRNSNHAVGMAADLLIDGSYQARAGYDVLAQVAVEEGLRTLGARDPGHIELPGTHNRGGAGQTMNAGMASAAGGGGVAQVAAVAAPAGVAAPAAVAAAAAVAAPAGLARVAGQPGGWAARRTEPVSAGPRYAAAPTEIPASARSPLPPEAVLAAVEQPAGLHPMIGQPSLRTESGSRDSEAFSESGGDAVDMASGPGGAAGRADGPAAGRTGAVAATTDTDIASRIARVLQLQADAAAQPLSRVMLHLGDDAAMGRVRIDLRSGAVGTTIDLNDPVAATELRARLHELETALNRRGLEAAELRVGAVGAADAATRVRPIAAGPGVEPAPQTLLDSLLAQYTARNGERQADGGRHGQDSQRRSRGDQSQQEAK